MSAVIKLAAPAANTPAVLEQVVREWMAAKAKEDAAKAERIAIEDQIFALHAAPEEGSSTAKLPTGLKVTVTGKLSYKCADLDALREITRQWDAHMVPLKTTTALDETGCKYLRAKEPALWAQIAKVIEIKPAKAAVKVGA